MLLLSRAGLRLMGLSVIALMSVMMLNMPTSHYLQTSYAANLAPSVQTTASNSTRSKHVTRQRIVKVAVVSQGDTAETKSQWEPMARYLSNTISGYSFQILPVQPEGVGALMKQSLIDFYILDPLTYTQMHNDYGVVALTTRKRTGLYGEQGYPFQAAVFVVKKDARINDVKDMKNKHIAATSEQDYSSWLLAWDRLMEEGVDPLKNRKDITFYNTNYSQMMTSLIQGSTDVAILPAPVFSSMVRNEEIAMSQVRIVGNRVQLNYPYPVSTELYPDWAFAVSQFASDDLTKKINLALLDMTPSEAGVSSTQLYGWASPQSYRNVEALQQNQALYESSKKNALVKWFLNEVVRNSSIAWVLLGSSLLGMLYIMRQQTLVKNELAEQLKQHDLLGKRLEYQALYDTLTQLPNRRLFSDRLFQAIKLASRERKVFGIMMIDLDRFKEINDTMGHHAGDELLQQVSQRFKSALRDSDTLARLGGDEFSVIFHGVDSQKSVQIVANRLLESLEEPIVIDGVPITAGGSLGISLFPVHGQDPEILLRRADIAMYRAKEKRGTFAIFDSEADRKGRDHILLQNDLRNTLKEEALDVHFQPKINCITKKVEGAEALARWFHPVRGLISPGLFIPIAEDSGLIKSLTMVVLKKSIHQASLWYQAGMALNISVNVTAENIEDPKFAQEVWYLLKRFRLPPRLLELEITEDAIINNLQRANKTTDQLTQMGVTLSIDDFGTGNSSISYLKKLPISTLKIDFSFVKEMLRSKDDAAIVKSTIALGKNMGLSVIAEGIEDLETLEVLTKLGCDMGQGFYMCKPIPGAEFDQWLRTSEWGIPSVDGNVIHNAPQPNEPQSTQLPSQPQALPPAQPTAQPPIQPPIQPEEQQLPPQYTNIQPAEQHSPPTQLPTQPVDGLTGEASLPVTPKPLSTHQPSIDDDDFPDYIPDSQQG